MEAIVASSRVGFSLKTSRSALLSLYDIIQIHEGVSNEGSMRYEGAGRPNKQELESNARIRFKPREHVESASLESGTEECRVLECLFVK
jgi:hypothetical protein